MSGNGPQAPAAPRVAVLACMDARLDPVAALGLGHGEAHVIRNAGGVASEDAIRSIVISQRLMGTREVALVHHTDCGMEKFTDAGMKDQILAETGIRPPFAFESFPRAEDDLRQTAARIKANPFVAHEHMRAFMYDVVTGRVTEVELG